MNGRATRAALALLVIVLFALTAPLTPASASSRAGVVRNAATVRVSVVGVNPTSPALSVTPKRLTVTLAITNLTAKPLTKLAIKAERGDPIETQRALDKSVAKSPWPQDGLPITTKRPVQVNVAAGATARVSFPTETDIVDNHGICLCHQAVYPLFFGAFDHSDGDRLGYARTYLPVFSSKPAPVQVAWVWPLIDRPHRTTSDTVFADDALSGLVGVGGRLDKSLTVLERVAAQRVPITVLIDPELLDELEVMSTRNYTVYTSATTAPVEGIGRSLATAWLARLSTLLTNHPGVQVKLTPYADPDVQTLSARHLSWAPTVAGTAMARRVATALAGRPLSYDTAWPAAGAIGPEAMQRLRGDGVRTVLVSSAAVIPQQESSVPTSLARLRSGTTQLATALLSPTLQEDADAALGNTGDAGLSHLPRLAAEIAIRAAQEPDVEHQLVLAAPRYVDPDVANATRTIMDTTRAPYTVGSSLSAVTAAANLPTQPARPSAAASRAPHLPGTIVDEANASTTVLPTLKSMLTVGTSTNPTAKPAFLAQFPAAVQRSTSSAWIVQRALGTARAEQLNRSFAALLGGVHIVIPTSRSYTLGSSNSTLPITVQNDLTYPVRVRVLIQTVNNVPGFDLTDDIGAQTIAARSKRTLHLQTNITRSGRIAIEAQLQTPDAESIGAIVPLTVHSTALGIIGIVITAVAGAVLVIALVLRFARRLRRRTPARSTSRVRTGADPVGTGRPR